MSTLMKLNFQGRTFLRTLEPGQGLDEILKYASERFKKPEDSLVLFGDESHKDLKDAIETNDDLDLLRRQSSYLKLSLREKRFTGQDSEASEHEVEVAKLAKKHNYCFTREEILMTIRHSRDSLDFASRNLDLIPSFCLSELDLDLEGLRLIGRGRRDVVQFFLEHNHKSKQVLAEKTSLKTEGKGDEATLRNAASLIERNEKRLFGLLDYNLHKTSLVFLALNDPLINSFPLSHFAGKLSNNKLPEKLYSTLFASDDPAISGLVKIIRGCAPYVLPPDIDPEKKQIIEKARKITKDFFDEDEEKEIFRVVLECLSPLSIPLPPSTPPYPLITIICILRPKPEPVVGPHGPFYMLEIFRELPCTRTKTEDERIKSLGEDLSRRNHLAVAIPSEPEKQNKFFTFYQRFFNGRNVVDLLKLFDLLAPEVRDHLSTNSASDLDLGLINEENIRSWAGVFLSVSTKKEYRAKETAINKKKYDRSKHENDPKVLEVLWPSDTGK